MNFLPTLPDWATTPEAQAWFYGFVVGGSIRIFRTCLRWVKRIGADHYGRD